MALTLKIRTKLQCTLLAALISLSHASSGTGSASHLGLEMLKLYAKLDMVNVSYKGAAPSIAGLLGVRRAQQQAQFTGIKSTLLPACSYAASQGIQGALKRLSPPGRI